MIKLYDRSITKLIELEDELYNARQDEIPGALRDLIDVQKVLLEKLIDNPDVEHANNLEVFRRKLVTNLVRYGAYLNVENRKDYQVEASSLKLATAYDPSNQVAFYRLGVLAYEAKRFAEAVGYFQNALEPTQVSEGYRFKLTPQQEYNAVHYIRNSGLSTAKAAHVSLGNLIGDIKRSELEQSDFSILSDWIDTGDEYLKNHEYVVVSSAGKRYCSQRKYSEIVKSIDSNTLIIDFTGKSIELRFNTRVTSVSLSALEAELLGELMLFSSEDRPLRGGQLQEPIFSNTYRQKITRLRNLIGMLELSAPAIKNKTIRVGASRVTAHYYNQTLPYLLIYRESEMY